jgi:AcrR family transcriptional regulator
MSSAPAPPFPSHEGVLPTKQQRSRDTRDRLLAAGYRLVEESDFDAMPVAAIAAQAGCSVGAFYFLFADKDSFLRALVAAMLEHGRAEVPALLQAADAVDPAATVVRLLVASFRRRPGLLRSALRRSMEDPAVWAPLREQGRFVADQLVAALARHQGRKLTKAAEQRTRFAFQMVMGTLVNALVNQPGPLQLGDARLEEELLRAFRLVMASG